MSDSNNGIYKSAVESPLGNIAVLYYSEQGLLELQLYGRKGNVLEKAIIKDDKVTYTKKSDCLRKLGLSLIGLHEPHLRQLEEPFDELLEPYYDKL